MHLRIMSIYMGNGIKDADEKESGELEHLALRVGS